MSALEIVTAGGHAVMSSRGKILQVIRRTPSVIADPRRDGAMGKAAVGMAIFAGGLAVGLAGALLLPRSRRAQWEHHADRALKLASEIGLALANEAMRAANAHEVSDIPVAAKPGQNASGGGMAGLALRVLRRRGTA